MPKDNNVLQPEPRSGEGCNALLLEGLANVNAHGKECYIIIVIYLSYSTCTVYLFIYFIYLFIYLLHMLETKLHSFTYFQINLEHG